MQHLRRRLIRNRYPDRADICHDRYTTGVDRIERRLSYHLTTCDRVGQGDLRRKGPMERSGVEVGLLRVDDHGHDHGVGPVASRGGHPVMTIGDDRLRQIDRHRRHRSDHLVVDAMKLNRFAGGFENRQRLIDQCHDGSNLDRMAGAVDDRSRRGFVGNQSVQRKQADETFDVTSIIEVDAPVKERRLRQVVFDTLDRLVPCRVRPEYFGGSFECPVLDIGGAGENGREWSEHA